MSFDWTSAAPSSSVRALALAAMVVVLALPTACRNGGSGSGCVVYGSGTDFAFDESITVGFDDLSTTGVLMGVAIDDNGVMGAPDSALVIALQFPLSVSTPSRSFSPTCDTAIAIDSYTYEQTDLTTTDTAEAPATEFVALSLTDSAGALGMDHSMNALLTIEGTPDRYFLAVSGTIVVTRDDGSSPTTANVTGALTFVELDDASVTANILDGGAILRIDDIDFDWSTTLQP